MTGSAAPHTPPPGPGRRNLLKYALAVLLPVLVFLANLALDATGPQEDASSSGSTSAAQAAQLSGRQQAAAPGQTTASKPQSNKSQSNKTQSSKPTTTAQGRYPQCKLDTLPHEVAEVVADILAGGPFLYPDNDGVRFGNYEGVLPRQARSYYREYTVETPGLRHRGARRIVTGGGKPTDPEVWYYTADHYETFCQIPDAAS